ncbi:cobalt-precorrin 5A hydrolase [Desulfitobacterium sp.]|uniref:cobalt-precorrin 5A hydrolase n=1 Tax=Desulfitobacterium sp. TaxID=49981 RepID=UPI002CB9649C|nr:cobalamin biosynthesis protein [Desulfitobacterium sp.]HVJ48296.1 cobalamin biosynthesis protein [Desulfitobacterium sp.]
MKPEARLRGQSAVIVLTDQGLATGERILRSLREGQCSFQIEESEPSLVSQTERSELWVHRKCHVSESGEEEYHTFERLAGILPDLWTTSSLLIFVMATGIVVRQISPFLQSKDRDPAVLVLDEKGQFVISLLSGHLGGANAWASEIAYRINAQPVITTATDVQGLIAPDEYARRLGWMVEPVEGLKNVNRCLLDTGRLKVWSEVSLSPEHPLRKDEHYIFVSEDEKEDAPVWVTPFLISSTSAAKTVNKEKMNLPWITLVPRILSIGIGSRRGISKELILEAIQEALTEIGASEKSIFGMFSIDIKQQEVGMIEAARELGVPFRTFAATEIQSIVEQQELSRSEYVKDKIGVDGVCEAASLLGTRQGKLILPKQKRKGVTVAISMERFLS